MSELSMHWHEIIAGRTTTEATRYADGNSSSSHLHLLHDGRPEPANVYGRWHTHRGPASTITAETFEVGRLL